MRWDCCRPNRFLVLNTLIPGMDLTDFTQWQQVLVLRMISALLGAAAVFLLCLIHPLAGLFLALDTFGIKYTSVIYLEALPGSGQPGSS